MEFLGDRRAADDRAALEHRDLEPGRGQVGGADQAVMAAADDERVALIRGTFIGAILVELRVILD